MDGWILDKQTLISLIFGYVNKLLLERKHYLL